MTLLHLSIAYLLGIGLGRLLWDLQWFGCTFPNWLWLLPVGILPIAAAAINHLPVFQHRPVMPMCWTVQAGFEVPRSGPSPALVAAVALALCAGTLRYAAHPLTPCWTPVDLAHYNLPADRAFDDAAPFVTLTGYISSYPLVSDTKQRLHVVAQSITTIDDAAGITGNTPLDVHGALRLTTGIRQRYAYGQPVRLHGRLVTPPDFEDFSYREYLARKNIHSLLYNARIEVLSGQLQGGRLAQQLYALRARGEQLLNRLLPEPYAALANGMLLGIEAGIPDELYEQFNLTGTSHTIVISGMNETLTASLYSAICKC